jgi:hypothetical protein
MGLDLGRPYLADEEIGAAFAGQASDTAIAAAIKEIEHDGWEWAPAGNRMQPEVPRDPVVRAKQRLGREIEDWCCHEADDSSDPAVTDRLFNIADVALLLRDHRRLQQLNHQESNND